MQFSIHRSELLTSLQLITGVIEKRQSMPILSNILLIITDENLRLVATDLDIEIMTNANIISSSGNFSFTIPGRKIYDICRTLPENSIIDISVNDTVSQALIKSGRSRFNLSMIAGNDFPELKFENPSLTINIQQQSLKHLIDMTQYAMGVQDVRHFLNGLLIEVNKLSIKAVATDGHRLAYSELDDLVSITDEESLSVIIPRKSINELNRLFTDQDQTISLSFSSNHLRVVFAITTFTTVLIDGQFPEYRRVIPKNLSKCIICDKVTLKSALTRAAILSSEKYRSVVLSIDENTLKAQTNNPEREEKK